MSHSILRIRAVQEKTGLSHTTIYKLIADKSFPKQIKLGGKAVGFLAQEIDDWIESRIAASRVN